VFGKRCTARADALDDEICGRRSQEHTEILVKEFELGILWDEYGLVGDIIVFLLFLSLYVALAHINCTALH
jgi:hypothetical protein